VRFRVLCVFVVSLFAAILINAQDQGFEVASVKRNTAAPGNSILRMLPGGRVNAVNFPVRQMIIYAWRLAGFQVAGGPSWINTDGYDVVAKVDGNPAPAEPGKGQTDPMQRAMQNLLAERFKLKFHREMREMDIYALVLAKPGGAPGPKLIQSPQDCAAQAAAARGRSGPPPAPGPPPALGTAYCGIFGGPGRIRFGGLNSTMLARALNPYAGRMVVDRTGLSGSWDFELKFAAQGRGPGPDAPAPDPDAPDFFTAIQEQLGLKLESTKGPVEVLVIDSVERPTED
jgi:uncharacterized protein (TIGR03435 family)